MLGKIVCCHSSSFTKLNFQFIFLTIFILVNNHSPCSQKLTICLIGENDNEHNFILIEKGGKTLRIYQKNENCWIKRLRKYYVERFSLS